MIYACFSQSIVCVRRTMAANEHKIELLTSFTEESSPPVLSIAASASALLPDLHLFATSAFDVFPVDISRIVALVLSCSEYCFKVNVEILKVVR